MPDHQSRLIEAAVRPFSDNAELKHSAAGFLETRITKGAAEGEMLARWDEVDARKRKSVWHIGLWVMVAVVSAVVAISDFGEIARLVAWGKSIAAGSIYAPGPVDSEQLVARKLNESDKLLLFGDLSKETKAERKEALWRSEPDNPAYFADYASAFIGEHEKLPPDFLKTARRIDPTNAWFTYLAAGVEATDSVKGKSRKSKRVKGKTVYDSPKSWEIRDQARLDRAIELLREARNQPKCTSYSAAMLRKRLPLLPEATFIEQFDSVACLAGVSDFSNIRLMRLAQAIAAKACSVGESGDVQGFQEISDDCDRFIRGICSGEMGTLLDQVVTITMVGTLAESFSSSAEKFGLENEVPRWKPIEEWVAGSRGRREAREFIVNGSAVKPGTTTGSIIGGSIEMIASRPETQPPLTDADLEPMRLFEHEFLSRGFTYVTWAMMALCACLVASYRFRVAILSRRLTRRMEHLLRPSDWGWIFAVGVMLPFVFVMAVNRLTPLGGRELGVQGMELLMPGAHFFGLLLLWLTLPVQVVRWRLAKRADGFGFSGPSLIGWLAVACAAAFVPMIGWAAISGMHGSWMDALALDMDDISKMPWQFWTALELVVVTVLWVTALISLAMLGRADRHIYRATSAFLLIKVFAAAMLVIALASIGFKASERYWFKRDWMWKFDVSGPGWNAFESKVAAQMRKELRETLGYD
jgi:hypothetical protein